jgi:hypothetical protein
MLTPRSCSPALESSFEGVAAQAEKRREDAKRRIEEVLMNGLLK